jgi:hypothetical protein
MDRTIARGEFRTAATAVAIALTLAACGGDVDAVPEGAESGLPGLEADAPDGTTAANIRFVHLWSHEGATRPIDVYVQAGFGAQQPVAEGIELGDVVTFAVPARATLYAYRAGEAGLGEGYRSPALVSVEDLESALEGGIPLTIVLSPAPTIGERPGGDMSVFLDSGDEVMEGLPARSPNGSMLVANMNPLAMLDGGSLAGLKIGMPGVGCLPPAGSTPRPGISVSGGGHVVMQYDAPPGSLEIAAYAMDDVRCTSEPVIGPVPVELPSSGRSYLFAFGTNAGDLRLLHIEAMT